VDAELFPDEPRPLLVLNLGGIANLTALDSDGALIALDVGPANSLLDGLARRHLGRPFDSGGRAAGGGRPDEDWIAAVLDHPFYLAPPPKSTGRDTFGESWIEALVARGAQLDPADQLRSAAEAIAISVARALEPLPRAARLLVAGGGVHHGPLMAALGARTGLEVVPTSVAGIDPDAREAVAFAVLAGRALRGVASSHPGATGARSGAILGKISPLGVLASGSRAPTGV
jgi:anhydro-N-acetylmuramic acid kinase